MWLINTTTLELHSFLDAENAPDYAILSHCWDEEEMTFSDFRKGRNCTGPGYRKIEDCCRFVRNFSCTLPTWITGEGERYLLQEGMEWVWIDTVCIDKRSSAELSEAINSMFAWYQQARICIVYLEDMDSDVRGCAENLEPLLRQCKWFTRGWTLQELIAPVTALFLDTKWCMIGQKPKWTWFESEDFTHEPVWLTREIEAITGIPSAILDGSERLTLYSVAQRLSWASQRNTSREEDMAYCLLGLFDINMPLIYGEGGKAFRRLQKEIMAREPDDSIFAWVATPTSLPRGLVDLLAVSPANFFQWGKVVKQNNVIGSSLAAGDHGWNITVKPLSPYAVFSCLANEHLLVVRLRCALFNRETGTRSLCLLVLRRVVCGHFVRVDPRQAEWKYFDRHLLITGEPPEEACVERPSEWKPIEGPETIFVHTERDDLNNCGARGGRKVDEDTQYICLRLGEEQPRMVEA